MKIKRIKIKNYRLLKDFSIDLEDNLSLIVGKNNSGKTSVLYILDKFLNNKVNSFSWDDFNVTFREKFEKTIQENGKFSYDNIDNFSGICLRIFIEYDSNDNLSNVRDYMLDLDENNKTIILEFSYTITKENFLELLKKYSKANDKETFLEKNFSNYFFSNHRSIIYDTINEKEGDLYKDLLRSNANINKLISFKYIDAKRDISNKEENKLATFVSDYYKNIDRHISEKTTDDFNNIVNKTDEEITNIYGEIFKDIIIKIKKFGGIEKEESLIKIVSSINKEKLLEGNSKVMYEENNYNLPENYSGLGYLNLFHMIFSIELKLMDFRKDSEPNEFPADINLFFIEEPEVHTHPQMQYIFIENIKTILKEGCLSNGNNLNLQTIITTHSSHIVSKSDFNDIKYFYKDIDNSKVISRNLFDLKKEYGENENHFKFLKQYLTLNRSELFFAEKAIFIEGVSERILLPKMMEIIDEDKSDSLPLLSQNISIIEIGNYAHIFEKFIDFIGLKTLIITDIDSGKLNDEVNVVKSPVKEGTKTTNSSLKFFFPKKSLEELKNMKYGEKVLKKEFIKKDNKKKWSNNESGILMVSFQIFQDSVDYYPRTFEDSFVSLNKKFIEDNLVTFKSLKNKDEFSKSTDFYELTEKIIGKKSAFAIEVLIASQDSKIQIPYYIKEGLLWLKKI